MSVRFRRVKVAHQPINLIVKEVIFMFHWNDEKEVKITYKWMIDLIREVIQQWSPLLELVKNFFKKVRRLKK